MSGREPEGEESITWERGKAEIRGEINTRSLGNEPPAISVWVDRVPPPTPEATHRPPPPEPTCLPLPLNTPCSPLSSYPLYLILLFLISSALYLFLSPCSLTPCLCVRSSLFRCPRLSSCTSSPGLLSPADVRCLRNLSCTWLGELLIPLAIFTITVCIGISILRRPRSPFVERTGCIGNRSPQHYRAGCTCTRTAVLRRFASSSPFSFFFSSSLSSLFFLHPFFLSSYVAPPGSVTAVTLFQPGSFDDFYKDVERSIDRRRIAEPVTRMYRHLL